MPSYTTPEVQGRILFLLVRPQEFDYKIETLFDSWAIERKKAVNTMLAWIQSKRHCREVLEHMGVNIPQGGTTTITALSLTVSGDNFSGTASWNWTDDFDSCSGSTSVAGTFVAGSGGGGTTRRTGIQRL
jgi:hypothetical protein